MTTDERKRVLKSRLVAAGALSLVVVGLAVWYVDRITPSKKHMSASEYFATEEGEAALVLDGELLEGKGKALDEGLYLPCEEVSSSINPSVFYEDTEDILLLTGPTKKESYGIASAPGEQVLRAGEEIYLSEPFLASVTKGLFSVYEEPARCVILTEDHYTAMTLAEDAPIRRRAGIKSPILKDCEAGTKVYVLDVNEDGEPCEEKIQNWTKVFTEDGFTGYIEDRFLFSPERREVTLTDPLGEYTRCFHETPVNMVFHQTTDQASNAALTQSLQGVSGINVIAPTWFFLDRADGSLTDLSSEDYVKTAHDAGLEVWAVLNDFDGSIASAGDTAAALSSDASRSAIVAGAMEGLRISGADGLCLDIELVSKAAVADYLELIREFSAQCRNAGKTLSICNYVPLFTNYLNRKEQARVADYLIVMCYDEHTASSKEAGSVASLPFVKNGLAATLEQVPKEQVIAAIPFYTRLWQTSEDGTLSSKSLGMSGAASRMEELGMEMQWKEEAGQNYAEKKEGGVLYQIWVEDAASIARKMEAVTALGCAGVAEWKLGLETSEIWDVIKEALFNSIEIEQAE